MHPNLSSGASGCRGCFRLSSCAERTCYRCQGFPGNMAVLGGIWKHGCSTKHSKEVFTVLVKELEGFLIFLQNDGL